VRITREWYIRPPAGEADREVEACRTTLHVIAQGVRDGRVRPEQWDYAKRDLVEAWRLRDRHGR
jgi:hypothetical protein